MAPPSFLKKQKKKAVPAQRRGGDFYSVFNPCVERAKVTRAVAHALFMWHSFAYNMIRDQVNQLITQSVLPAVGVMIDNGLRTVSERMAPRVAAAVVSKKSKPVKKRLSPGKGGRKRTRSPDERAQEDAKEMKKELKRQRRAAQKVSLNKILQTLSDQESRERDRYALETALKAKAAAAAGDEDHSPPPPPPDLSEDEQDQCNGGSGGSGEGCGDSGPFVPDPQPHMQETQLPSMPILHDAQEMIFDDDD